MTNDTVVQALLDYLNESDEPEIFWPRHHFEESCFSRWAAWEMIEAFYGVEQVETGEVLMKD